MRLKPMKRKPQEFTGALPMVDYRGSRHCIDYVVDGPNYPDSCPCSTNATRQLPRNAVL